MTQLFASTPDNDGDSLTVHSWDYEHTHRDRPYLLNVATKDRDDNRAPALLDRADAEKLVKALAAHLGWETQPLKTREDATLMRASLLRAAAREQSRDDALMARDLVPGTLIRIHAVPMRTRTQPTSPSHGGISQADGGKLAVVLRSVDSTRAGELDPIGWRAGRVVVTTDLDSFDPDNYVFGKDLHVSSLTVVTVPPAEFSRDPAPEHVYTPLRDYRVGDTVIVDNPAYVTTRSEGTKGWVSPSFYGSAGRVDHINVGPHYTAAAVEVEVGNSTQTIATTSLRNISAEFRAADIAAGGTL
jgi:ribosomal protein L21E